MKLKANFYQLYVIRSRMLQKHFIANTMLPFLSVWMLVLYATCVQYQAEASDIIDLSHPLSDSTLYWPGMPSFNRTLLAKGRTEDGVWIAVGAFSSGEHGGTHMDAPNHFSKDGFDMSEVPLEMAVAPGVHIDVRAQARADSSYVLSLEKLLQWERKYGPVPQRAAVLVNFGWSSRWPDPNVYFNTENISDPLTFTFPYVSPEVTKYLLQRRNINLLGVDSASPDSPRDPTFPTHVLMLPRNKLIVENMLIPDTLPARGFTVHAAPVKVVGGTGVPTRVYAILDEPRNTAQSTWGVWSREWLAKTLVVIVAGTLARVRFLQT